MPYEGMPTSAPCPPLAAAAPAGIGSHAWRRRAASARAARRAGPPYSNGQMVQGPGRREPTSANDYDADELHRRGVGGLGKSGRAGTRVVWDSVRWTEPGRTGPIMDSERGGG